MHCIMAIIVSSLIIKVISSETTKDPASSKDVQPPAGSAKDVSKLDSVGSNPILNSLWVYQPEAHQSHVPGDAGTRRVVMKPAHSLTRLAKTLTLGFDPYFSKGYFEPFERRPKPVTLVAFRKNGLLPRTKTNTGDGKSGEVAELQSPFNDISNFWVDD
ncbi:uncharacterized protein LOC135086819 isoform X2 [Ostrinia nubilalis]|uniref:uncharacterized protein LOC114359513 n=1 Tax=Ostrinia furnacalis TaxID=93504 RepID=UPI001038DC59|nr:uncharacterized protein LOC114359513 [Ostrinia furnacalis]